jgi:superfamily II DNA or RNA helicase
MGDTVYDRTTDGRFLDYKEKSLFVAREGQETTIRESLRLLNSEGGSLLIANCGTGKTVQGAEIAVRLGLSTCVLVHKEFLVKQWEEAFKLVAPWFTVGRMQRDVVDTGRTHDIVVAVTQSVVNPKRDYPSDFYESFGLIICDEVHRYGASLWQKAITRFPAKYRLGLTATPERADGLWRVITSHISPRGPVLQAVSLMPEIYILKTDVEVPPSLWDLAWLDDTAKRAKLVSALSTHRGRNEKILRYIIRAFNAGRKVLVISERRAQLDHFFKRLTEEAVGGDEVGSYVGGTKQAKLDIAAQKSIVLTTYQMSKEGLNIPDLDTLIMATPQSSVQQTVGRILRSYEGKGQPVVLDFVDMNAPLIGSGMHRRSQYKKLGYHIHG